MDKNKWALSEEEWKQRLTPEQYRIMRKKGTEIACSGAYWDTKKSGIYHCAACGLPLFSAETKFDSGTGWPSFLQPLSPEVVEYSSDWHIGYERTEVLCAQCGSHLGHVFPDGPPPTGKRYCMNSVALQLSNP